MGDCYFETVVPANSHLRPCFELNYQPSEAVVGLISAAGTFVRGRAWEKGYGCIVVCVCVCALGFVG